MSPDFLRKIESGDIDLVFPNQSAATHIRELFVYPQLQAMRSTFSEELRMIDGDSILSRLKHIPRWLISSDDQSGKTTFSRILFLDCFSEGYTPVLLSGEKIKTSNIEKLLSKRVSDIYSDIDYDSLLEREDLVLIIDDLSKSTINASSMRRLIKEMNEIFSRVIIFSGESLQFAAPDFPSLDEYEKIEMVPFGHYCRNQLIDRWVALELGEEVNESQIYKREDELKTHVEALVRKNIVPAKPVYILMIIKAFNITVSRRYDLTSYGHCYEYLIYQALDKAHIKKSSDIDQHLNFLSELGKAVLDSGCSSLSEEKLTQFYEYYDANFIVTDIEKMVDNLTRASILEKRAGKLRFKYRYLFYFFASKNLAETLHEGDTAKETIVKLIETTHLEKSSNIVLFLSHHSKDPWILERISSSITNIFPKEKEATLEPESLKFLRDFANSIPDLVVEHRDAREERRKQDIRKDEIERSRDTAAYDEQEDDIDPLDSEDASIIVKRLEKAFRSTEVCGQILRNRIGSLEKNRLKLLYAESATVLLQLLNIILETSKVVQEEGIRSIESALRQSPSLTNEEIALRAKNLYMEINYLLIFAVLRKLSFSLGSESGRQIYEKVAEEKNTPAFMLVQTIMELQFEKRLNHARLSKLHKQFVSSKNPVCDRLLKMIVVHHLYMHEVSYKDRQAVASNFGLELRSLQFMESRKQERSKLLSGS